jgi:hypothetical protein
MEGFFCLLSAQCLGQVPLVLMEFHLPVAHLKPVKHVDVDVGLRNFMLGLNVDLLFAKRWVK